VVQQSLGNLEGAIADFNHAIAINPGYAQAYCNRGIARQGLAERVRPTRARPFGDHAGASPARGDLAEALADFDRAVELSPRKGAALIYHNRGAARQAQGDLAGALRDYDEALAIDGAHGATYANRGTARKAIGDLEGARADLDRALELTPAANAAAVYHNRGGVRVLQDDFAGAIADYDEALRLDPHLLVAWLSRGNARYHQRDPRAFMDHRHAIAVQPDFAVPEIIAMVADDLRRDEPGVLRNCEKHLRINRQDVTAYFRRGLSRLLLGQEVEGEEDLESIRQLQPDLERELGLLGAEAKRRRIR
jgi:tetratricopeptide (TPR) repeat protein